MFNSQEKALKFIKERKHIKTSDIVKLLNVSRQRAHVILSGLVKDDKIIKIGSTAKSSYALPDYASSHLKIFPTAIERRLRNRNLEEHKVLDEIENNFSSVLKLPENVKSIFTYAFSEMLNNAIEHSQSINVDIKVSIKNRELTFEINDFGIGVFKNIMEKKKLNSELEAIQDLLKGKTTTIPKSHSGEGIFFTSKISDIFILESFDYQLVINNQIQDLFLGKLKKTKKGTKVKFTIDTESIKHLGDLFRKFSNMDEKTGSPAFNKTEIKIKLYTIGDIHISRSQARRVLTELDKFNKIVFDFDKVPMVGQAFADEIFRVFKNKNPDIELEAINMNEAVKFMVDRARGNNPRTPNLLGPEC